MFLVNLYKTWLRFEARAVLQVLSRKNPLFYGGAFKNTLLSFQVTDFLTIRGHRGFPSSTPWFFFAFP